MKITKFLMVITFFSKESSLRIKLMCNLLSEILYVLDVLIQVSVNVGQFYDR